ncbi:MAG: hypothetical protein ACUVV0_15715 [Anaerolineae bacterium]
MTRRQWATILVLVFSVSAVFCILGMLITRDIYQDFQVLLALLRAEMTPVPTVVYVPPPPPTDTPPPIHPSTSTAGEAIALVQGFKYNPNQSKTVSTLISTLLQASEQMGNDLRIDGWWAEDQGNDQWIVTFGFWENSRPTAYRFWVDTVAGTVESYNERANTLLTFLRQEARTLANPSEPTSLLIPMDGIVQDPVTQWEYSLPSPPRWVKSILGPDEEIFNGEAGFLIIPLRLKNLSPEPQPLDLNYYSRFSLHDSEGRVAAHLGANGFARPTRLWCEAQGLPHFVMASRALTSGEVLETALAFALLPSSHGPLTLDVTVNLEGTLHSFSFELGTPKEQ